MTLIFPSKVYLGNKKERKKERKKRKKERKRESFYFLLEAKREEDRIYKTLEENRKDGDKENIDTIDKKYQRKNSSSVSFPQLNEIDFSISAYLFRKFITCYGERHQLILLEKKYL